MSQKRMFSLKIIDTDEFLDMPATTQNLYFHLCMRADDDGFVSSPKKIMKIINSANDDMNVLCAKKFVIPFDTGICVIKHWKIHNLIRHDRYTETEYKQEKKALIEVDKKYELGSQNVIPDGNQMATQVRLDKVRLDKVSKEKDIKKENIKYLSREKLKEFWNNNILGLIPKIETINDDRYKKYKLRINEGIDFEKIFSHVKNSQFLQGSNNNNWCMSFDWLMSNSKNWIKIIEGNYDNKKYRETKKELSSAEIIENFKKKEGLK